MMQTDLFAWAEAQSKAAVVRLPGRVWGGTVWRDKVFCIAEAILKQTDPALVDRLWKNSQVHISRELAEMGASEQEVAQCLTDYRSALSIELGKMSSTAVSLYRAIDF